MLGMGKRTERQTENIETVAHRNTFQYSTVATSGTSLPPLISYNTEECDKRKVLTGYCNLG